MSEPADGAIAPIAGSSIRRSLLLSFAEKYSTLTVQFVTSMIVARLITPQAFGVFSIAFAIVGFAHVIREMGVNAYLVQRPTLEAHHIRAGLFATGIVAWGLGLLLIAASPLVGRLYGDDVRHAELILSLSFFVQPVSSTVFAVLQREMNFGALLRINLVGVSANAAIAVALSRAGWGFAGLAWASVIGQAVTSIVAIFYRPHREHFVPSMRGSAEVFRFGAIIMASSLLHQFSTNIANLITARFVSVAAIGLFSRAQSVTGLFSRLVMEAVQPLVLPVLAGMRRAGQDVGAAAWQSLAYIAAIAWPFFLLLALSAEPIVTLLFGAQWIEAAILLRLMSIGGLFWIVQPVAEPLLIAIGRPRLTLMAQSVNQTVAVIGVLIAAPYGVVAVAAAAIAISAVHAMTWLVVLGRVLSLRSARLPYEAGRAVLITAATLALPAALAWFWPALAPLPRLLLTGLGATAGWLVGIFCTAHPVTLELRALIRHLAPRAIRLRMAFGGTGG